MDKAEYVDQPTEAVVLPDPSVQQDEVTAKKERSRLSAIFTVIFSGRVSKTLNSISSHPYLSLVQHHTSDTTTLQHSKNERLLSPRPFDCLPNRAVQQTHPNNST